MCEDERGSPPVMPYIISGNITTKAPKFRTLIVKWNGDTQEVEIDKEGNYLINMANFTEWDKDNIFEPHFTLELKEETQ